MKNRPLSPHLQIYKPQITSILSILHRFTGIALVGGIILFFVGFLSLVGGETSWSNFEAIYTLSGGKIWQWLLIFAFHYHAINGIRHLLWDLGWGFSIESVTKTGQLTILFSLFLTLFLYLFVNEYN
jgi:succinate dehydrogenase / fumarate reductase cytochrome b subunit